MNKFIKKYFLCLNGRLYLQLSPKKSPKQNLHATSTFGPRPFWSYCVSDKKLKINILPIFIMLSVVYFLAREIDCKLLIFRYDLTKCHFDNLHISHMARRWLKIWIYLSCLRISCGVSFPTFFGTRNRLQPSILI